MSAELPPRSPRRRKSPRTYFVARRPFEAAELYSVSATDVERFDALDWCDGEPSALKLSHVLLDRVVEPEPSGDLAALFTLAVVSALPEDGFVLDSDTIWAWAKEAASSAAPSASPPPRKRSWISRAFPTRTPSP